MKTRKIKGVQSKKSLYGRLFILPWEIGFLLFFFIPLSKSVMFVFSKVDIGINGIESKLIGLDNIKYIFGDSAMYTDHLFDSLGSFAYSIPLIVILSMIIAVMLHKKFKGVTIFRSLFFITVIISTGVVVSYIRQDAVALSMRDSTGGNAYLSGMIDFTKILQGLGLNQGITKTLADFINQIFDLVWNCGVQTVLFISGFQSIPDQLYDVSKVEGASKWEEFWFVTFPMLRGTLIIVIIYTAVELLTDTNNPVISQAYTTMQQQNYGTSSAMLWTYFIISCGGLFIILSILNKLIFKKYE